MKTYLQTKTCSHGTQTHKNKILPALHFLLTLRLFMKLLIIRCNFNHFSNAITLSYHVSHGRQDTKQVLGRQFNFKRRATQFSFSS